jgi:hypothetical protein
MQRYKFNFGVFMKKIIGIAAIALFMTSSAFAASQHRLRKDDCKCYTNQPGCSGEALFSGLEQKCSVYGFPKVCIVYSNHGNSTIFLNDAVTTVSKSVGVPGDRPGNSIPVRK